MCLISSVGLGGRNDLVDVSAFQILFNLNIPRFPDPKPVQLVYGNQFSNTHF